MASHVMTIPELDRRMEADRSAFVRTVDALRLRLRQDFNELNPKTQIRQHPGAALIAAGLAALVAGRIAGGVVRIIAR